MTTTSPAQRSPARRRRGISAIRAAALALAVALMGTMPAPAAAQSPCGGFYVVGSGDSLIEIAQRCGVTVPALLAANPGVVDQRDMEEGDRLRIPSPSARQPTPIEACGPTYTVRSGDTLAEIAEKCGLTIPLLVAANPQLPDPLSIEDEEVRIRIPNISTAAVRDPATVAVAGPGVLVREASADTAEAGAAADTAAAEPIELERVEGVLERGPRCMRVRAADGARTAIAGEVGSRFRAGDRVVLMGVPAGEHDCATSPVFELRILYLAGG